MVKKKGPLKQGPQESECMSSVKRFGEAHFEYSTISEA